MYKVGDIVKCLVTGFKDYGMFVKIDDEYSGLIHISEISEGFVKNVSDYGESGEIIYAKVIDVSEEEKHLKLSIKDIHYKIDGKDIKTSDEDGFKSLKNHLDIWVNEKLEEMNEKED